MELLEEEEFFSQTYPQLDRYCYFITHLQNYPAIPFSITEKITTLTSRAPTNSLEARAFAQLLFMLNPMTLDEIQNIITLEILTNDSDHTEIPINSKHFTHQKDMFLSLLYLKKVTISPSLNNFETALFHAKRSKCEKMLQKVYFFYGNFALSKGKLRLANHCFKCVLEVKNGNKNFVCAAKTGLHKICENAYKMLHGKKSEKLNQIRIFRETNEDIEGEVNQLLKKLGVVPVITAVRSKSFQRIHHSSSVQNQQRKQRSQTPIQSVASSSYSTETFRQKGVKKIPTKLIKNNNQSFVMDLATDFGFSRQRMKEIFSNCQYDKIRSTTEFKQSLMQNAKLQDYYSVGLVDLMPLPQPNSLFYGDDISIVGRKNVRCHAGDEEMRQAKDKVIGEVKYNKIYEEADQQYKQYVVDLTEDSNVE
ncbi:hypothetical protein SS50377_24355 [Spironucleus salmonicida]|uniref:Uncharacterized protein n=1 Tax=Spironucleus salmonicida TaxID=348837 RepID=V6LZ33_9EUKA|nr:hypothetical protein SS50377_24355 [Spironucleus salmonicida]|eukprot:EST46094.1 Hypothetical protein SS50377_14085 [Spironucleus salmonicida]